jgi:hypothetical protein
VGVAPVTRRKPAGRVADPPRRERSGAVAAFTAAGPPAAMSATIPPVAAPGRVSPPLLLLGALGLALLALAAGLRQLRRH